VCVCMHVCMYVYTQLVLDHLTKSSEGVCVCVCVCMYTKSVCVFSCACPVVKNC
jgi:hypothetical protein